MCSTSFEHTFRGVNHRAREGKRLRLESGRQGNIVQVTSNTSWYLGVVKSGWSSQSIWPHELSDVFFLLSCFFQKEKETTCRTNISWKKKNPSCLCVVDIYYRPGISTGISYSYLQVDVTQPLGGRTTLSSKSHTPRIVGASTTPPERISSRFLAFITLTLIYSIARIVACCPSAHATF